MNYRKIIYWWALIAIYFLPHLNLYAQSDTIAEKIDQFIFINKIRPNILVVHLGSDNLEAVTAVSTAKGIVVIDAGLSHSLTSRYRKLIEKEFRRNDFIYLINTHGHADHFGGNAVFAEAQSIAHDQCVEEMSDSRADPDKKIIRLQKIADDYRKKLASETPGSNDWKYCFTQMHRYQAACDDLKAMVPVLYPTITFSDRMELYTDNITFELKYFGQAHSKSDILIFIPEQKILWTGDLFLPGGRPSFNETDTTDITYMRSAIQWLQSRKDKIETIIGGHGDVMTKNDLESFMKVIQEKSTNIR